MSQGWSENQKKDIKCENTLENKNQNAYIIIY